MRFTQIPIQRSSAQRAHACARPALRQLLSPILYIAIYIYIYIYIYI